jgi:hypothetical protein
MSTQVTLDLPDEVYHRAKRLAQWVGRDVSDVLADIIRLSLPSQSEADSPISHLSDDEVLALTRLRLDAAQDRRLSDLLDKQNAGDLTKDEEVELEALMEVYEDALLRKSQALREAVQRGLREPLKP